MINVTGPESLFNSLKVITISGKFLYESDAESSLGPMADNSPGLSLPYNMRNLDIQISSIKLNDIILSHITTEIQLNLYLKKIQENVTQHVYSSYQINSMIAYLLRIKGIYERFTPKVCSFVDNYEVLLNEGYHPDLLDWKISSIESELTKQINVFLISPFKEWINSLIIIVEKSSSVRSARQAIKTRTNIIPDKKESRGPRIQLCFTLKRDRSIESLDRIYNFLIDRSMIIDTSYERWLSLFTNKNNSVDKIHWNDNKPGELHQFIDTLIKTKLIEDSPSKWATAQLHFDIIGCPDNLSSRLKSNSKSIRSKRIIELTELATEIVKDYASNIK